MNKPDFAQVRVLDTLRTQSKGDAELRQFVHHVDMLHALVSRLQGEQASLSVQLQMVWEVLRDPAAIRFTDDCPNVELFRELQRRLS